MNSYIIQLPLSDQSHTYYYPPSIVFSRTSIIIIFFIDGREKANV